MIRGVCVMAMLAAALGQPVAAEARGFDPIRCEAIEMRKEGQLYDCLARCERKDARREEPSAAKLEACQEACQTRYENSMARLEDREVCDGDAREAEPNRCHARLIRAAATEMTCEARCGTRAARNDSFDEDSCVDNCAERYDTTVERLMSKPFCAGMEFSH